MKYPECQLAARAEGNRPLRKRPQPSVWRSSALGVQGHRAVLLAGVVKEGYLVHAAVQQLPPVLAQPALGVSLIGEDGLLQARAAHHGTVRLLVPPGPGHPAVPPSRRLRHARLASTRPLLTA